MKRFCGFLLRLLGWKVNGFVFEYLNEKPDLFQFLI